MESKEFVAVLAGQIPFSAKMNPVTATGRTLTSRDSKSESVITLIMLPKPHLKSRSISTAGISELLPTTRTTFRLTPPASSCPFPPHTPIH
jgi:hypothetical protein